MSAWDIVFWIVLGTMVLVLLEGLTERDRSRNTDVDRLAERRARELSGRDA